jgi:hypothetical protein
MLLSVMVGAIAATGQGYQAEGDKPYTPTRREWIALELNATLHQSMSLEEKFSLEFVPPRYEEDTIVIFVWYLPTVDRQIMNLRIEAAKQSIAIEAKARGWSWLKVREQVEMKELKISQAILEIG